jgi:hypothetical protein
MIPSPFSASLFLTVSIDAWLYRCLMVIVTQKEIINERISFLVEQINSANKPVMNKTFQIQISAIMSIDYHYRENVVAIIKQKNELLRRIVKISMSLRSCLQSSKLRSG